MKQSIPYKCGFATIIGKPNVGKSTILNQLIQQKISITSGKPQTTRNRLLGIKSTDYAQVIYIDTPGIQDFPGNVMNRRMNRTAFSSMLDVDLIIYVIDSLTWSETDERLLSEITGINVAIVLVINKIDRIKSKKDLLPFIKNLEKNDTFNAIIPISAYKKDDIKRLEDIIIKNMPVAPAVYPTDQITDKNEKFIIAEFIREKLMRRLSDELPYQLHVTIEKFNEEKNIVKISAIIWVSSESQKAIVIGKNGTTLKAVGEKARKDAETLLGKQVFLNSWVKVRKKWMNDANTLTAFGFDQD